MSPYERGFHDGERAAFQDRKAGKPRRHRSKDEDEYTEYGRGYWDGYTPRSMTWALCKTPIKPYAEAEAV